MSRIVVGLSGGVDSSVAACLLKEQGHEVIGCRMRTFDTPRSLEEERSAALVAEKLGIPLYTEDFREEFRQEVIRYFAAEYGAGRTPNPCCICNRKVKWQALMRCMKRTGAQFVATGHYAAVDAVRVGTGSSAGENGPDGSNGAEQSREEPENVRYCIRSTCSRKDQSYALYNLTREEIACTMFPLAGMDKEEVRRIARETGLMNADQPDSMEICFIPDNDYAAFLKEHYGLTEEPGSYISTDGTVLGRHPGIVHLTVGQRKGLGIALGKKVFVKEIRPASNEVVLAEDRDVYTDSLYLKDVNFQAVSGEEEICAERIKIRYADPGTPGVMRAEGAAADGSRIYRIDFARSVRAATPGQAAVLYDGEGRILCGGTIL